MSELVRTDHVRQSTLASFDQCPLMTKFRLTTDQRSPSVLAARGSLAHLFFAAALEHMRAAGEPQIGVDMAMELLREVVAQRDVAPEDFLMLPTNELSWLRVLATKFAYNHNYQVENVVAVEERLYAKVPVVGRGGSTYERVISGAIDVLMADPPYGAVVVDYKAQPVDAKVLTPAGWREIGNLSVGEQVIGSDGSPTEVLGVYPQGTKEVFEVEVRGGGKTRSCSEHLWQVRNQGKDWRVMSLADLVDLRARQVQKWYTPTVAPVQLATREQEIDPYLLGILLGDGNLRPNGSVRFSSADPEIVAEIDRLKGDDVVLRKLPGATYDYSLSSVRRGLRSSLTEAVIRLGLNGTKSRTKFIPDDYLYGDVSQRLALLQGLMDSDGAISTSNQMTFRSMSRELAEGVLFLARSLGGRAFLAQWDDPTYGMNYGVQFQTPMVPFRLSRKAARWSRSKQTLDRPVENVRPAGSSECVCIKVAAANGLYVTDDFIVTHNTGFAPAPQKREPKPGEGAKEDRLSDLGYAQQVIYGLLVLVNYPSIESVKLREVYVMSGEVREATIERWQMERILDVVSTRVAWFDAAIDDGPDSLRWYPVGGSHCFGAETRFLTDRGVRTLGEAVGERVRVLNRFGEWEDAEVRAFGHQRLQNVAFNDGSTVRATAEHRWWEARQREGGRRWEPGVTRAVTRDMPRVPVATHAVMPGMNPDAIRHGIVFGDGSLPRNRGWSYVVLEPHKAELARFFEQGSVERAAPRRQGDEHHAVTVPDSTVVEVRRLSALGYGHRRIAMQLGLREGWVGKIARGESRVDTAAPSRAFSPVKRYENGKARVTMQDPTFKDLPQACGPEYARGFIAGLIATDGSVTQQGSVSISCQGLDRGQQIAELARLGGCVVGKLSIERGPTNYTTATSQPRELVTIPIVPATAPLIRSDQIARLKPNPQMRLLYRDIVSVEEDRVEEVFCVVSSASESFTLANGVITSNCSMCPQPRNCPIADEIGVPVDERAAARAAREWIVTGEARERYAEVLKGWVDVHGPIEVAHSKGRREVGWVESLVPSENVLATAHTRVACRKCGAPVGAKCVRPKKDGYDPESKPLLKPHYERWSKLVTDVSRSFRLYEPDGAAENPLLPATDEAP